MGLVTSSLAMDCLLILGAVCGSVFLYIKWTYTHWRKTGLPTTSAVFPLLGSLKESALGRMTLGENYGLIYRELKQYKCGGFFKFLEPTVMICDPDLIKDVLVKNFTHFHDNDVDITIDDDPMFGRNPFCLRGERWRVTRAQISPAFTPAKIKPHYFPLMKQVGQSLEDFLKQEQPEGLEARELASQFTTDVVASCVFGMNGDSFTDPNAIFRKMGKDIMSGDWWLNFKWMIIFLVPRIARLFKFKLFNDNVVEFFRDAVKESLHHRRKDQVAKQDFLQMMVQFKSQTTAEDGSLLNHAAMPLTDEDILAAAITFFSEGFETSATALSFTLYELALNTDVQERLRNDLDSALESSDGELTYDLIHEVGYLDMVISESLRLFSPAPNLTRQCTKPFSLPLPDGGEYVIKEGTPVAIPIVGLHYDPEYYPDPERFDPERFSEEQKATRHPYTYLPFGSGPRMCPGNRFAMVQVKVALVTIISRFEMRLCERTQVPITLEPASFIATAKGGVWIKFTKRTDK